MNKIKNNVWWMSAKIFGSVGLLLWFSGVGYTAQVESPSELVRRMGVDGWVASKPSVSQLKIAILDNGFAGFDPARALLPGTVEMPTLTEYPAAQTAHGLGMAQIVWSVMGQPSEGPQFLLLNSNGFSNFKASVEYAISKKVDVLLYSQTWPFGGNFDGTGFIDKLAAVASRAGILWINAAGNSHGLIFNRTGIAATQDIQFENQFDENHLTITLSWNDYWESETYRSRKDLDLFVLDKNGNVLASGELIQRGEAPPVDGTPSQLSSYARESVQLPSVDRGTYTLRIVAKSQNFGESDRFRVLIKADRGDGIRFLGQSEPGEIMPPADSSAVFTVGDVSAISSMGPTSDGRMKPDLLIQDARVQFSSGAEASGSSTASALFAGVVALAKAKNPSVSFAKVQEWIRQSWATDPASQPGASEGTDPASDPHLQFINSSQISANLRPYLPESGQVYWHTGRGNYIAYVPMDPFAMSGPSLQHVTRLAADDHLALNPSKNLWLRVSDADAEKRIKPPFVEFRRLKGEVSLSPVIPVWNPGWITSQSLPKL